MDTTTVTFTNPDVITRAQRKARQLGLWVRLTRLCKNSFPVNFVTDRAQQNCVSSFALFERTFGPFDLVFRVVMSAARNLFDLKVDLKQFPGRPQDAQSLRQDFRTNAVAG